MFTRRLLPAHHINPESKDVVRVGMSMVATTVALVLGLVYSAKSFYDTKPPRSRNSLPTSPCSTAYSPTTALNLRRPELNCNVRSSMSSRLCGRNTTPRARARATIRHGNRRCDL